MENLHVKCQQQFQSDYSNNTEGQTLEFCLVKLHKCINIAKSSKSVQQSLPQLRMRQAAPPC